MGIGGSIKILLKTAAINYAILLVLFIVMFYIDEQTRSTSAPEDMGGVFYVIIYFTAFYWVFSIFIYLTLGLYLQRLMLRKKYFDSKYIRNFALIVTLLAIAVLLLSNITDPLELIGTAVIKFAFAYFTAWQIRRYTLKEINA